MVSQMMTENELVAMLKILNPGLDAELLRSGGRSPDARWHRPRPPTRSSYLPMRWTILDKLSLTKHKENIKLDWKKCGF